MALTSAGFIAKAVEAADTIRGARRLPAFERAVHDFVALLASVPDYPAAAFGEADVARIGTVAEDVIAQVEERAALEADSPKAELTLVNAVYEIRSRLEQIDIWRRHFSRVQ